MHRSTKIHPADAEAMAAAYRAGTSADRLAAQCGTTPATVARVLHGAGIDTFPKRIPDSTIDRICHLYESGLSGLAVARQLDMPKSSVMNVLRRRGVKMRSELRGGAKQDA